MTTVEDIQIDKETREYLEMQLGKTAYSKSSNNIIRQIVGGVCHICGAIPTKKVIYKEKGGHIIEFYCSAHFNNRLIRVLDTSHKNETIAVVDKKSQDDAQ